MEAEKIETESNALSMRASEITIATQKRQGHENTQKNRRRDENDGKKEDRTRGDRGRKARYRTHQLLHGEHNVPGTVRRK